MHIFKSWQAHDIKNAIYNKIVHSLKKTQEQFFLVGKWIEKINTDVFSI